MFDITPDDIRQLNDVDLRELVARLCTAELAKRGISSVAVTWGGNQTAQDGGVDVRVEVPPGSLVDGFVPRNSTGFQVKTPAMPASKIRGEMCPSGIIRPTIQELAIKAGAYIIVSSKASATDSALQSRRRAMRYALNGTENAEHLVTDFYDRTRLADAVRTHPGLVVWVKERVGRLLIGWRPYGSWTGEVEGVDADYLLDEKLRMRLGAHREAPVESITQGIDQIRNTLSQPGRSVRLVGLSGVGKTRLVQAIFDNRIGSQSLPDSLAVYTNLSDNPDPHPTALASDLIANNMRAVLIVDNCPPELHRRLSELCRGRRSSVSFISVEYDVRADQPEGTDVITLDTSSPDLILKLVRRRYPHLSLVNARTIAKVSGGNARVAIALAETVGISDTIAGLSDDELFQRLFQQRHEANNDLLHAAEVCSLVYSFQGEALAGEIAELPRLALLASQDTPQIFRHVSELLRRNLAQKRGVWRAVLPHAIANRLAARALDNIPYDVINQQLVEGGTERLARSFSRRLSYLHDHPMAIAVVEKWLAPDGLLGDISSLNDLGRAMFMNVAPVLPEAAMVALERVGDSHSEAAPMIWLTHLPLLRSLAYEPSLFERSAEILARVATQSINVLESKRASDTFVLLFMIRRSGTHATIDQRLALIERLLRSPEKMVQALGLNSLDYVLKATDFTRYQSFEFGSRPRDYGYEPRCADEEKQWYRSAFALIEDLSLGEGILFPELRNLLAKNFRGLWSTVHMYSELELLIPRFAANEFWHEGWDACREAVHFDGPSLDPEARTRLSILEADLRPSTLRDQVRATVLGRVSASLFLDGIDISDSVVSPTEYSDAVARRLGEAVASDIETFDALIPDLLQGGIRARCFGGGLAGAASDVRALWSKLAVGLDQVPEEKRNAQVLVGFLAELSKLDRHLVHEILDSTFNYPAMAVFLPALQLAVGLDERGVMRLERSLKAGTVPVWMYRYLALGQDMHQLTVAAFKKLTLLIAGQIGGLDVALEIMYMRLFIHCSEEATGSMEVLWVGQDLLRRVNFNELNCQHDHWLAKIVAVCLADHNACQVAFELALRLKQAIADHSVSVFDFLQSFTELLRVQPAVVLDALFHEDIGSCQDCIDFFHGVSSFESNPADAISCESLISWCDVDREKRYFIAASIISFAYKPEADAPQVWSAQAKAILGNAPDPKIVLATIVGRFRPRSWSGSRVSLMEANAQLLESVHQHIPSELCTFVAETRASLLREIVEERRAEAKKDRDRNERFE